MKQRVKLAIGIVIAVMILMPIFLISKIENKEIAPTPLPSPIVKIPSVKPTSPETIPSKKVLSECQGLTEDVGKIIRLSKYSGKKGTELTVYGCNMAGFEGDLDVYFEREDGKTIMIYADSYHGNDDYITITISEPCQEGETVYGRYSGLPSTCDYIELTPGRYKVYVKPWEIKSNIVEFSVL